MSVVHPVSQRSRECKYAGKNALKLNELKADDATDKKTPITPAKWRNNDKPGAIELLDIIISLLIDQNSKVNTCSKLL